MNSIALMIEEHKNIKRMLKVLRTMSYRLLKEDTIDYNDFYKAIDFIKHYADEHHHGKEEQILFKEMVAHLGVVGQNLITHGMLVEHDYGRLYIRQLQEALDHAQQGNEESKLDIISNAIGYSTLLERHINKEDDIVYTYGEENLAPKLLEDINQRTQSFEDDAEQKGVQVHYLAMLHQLEEKYL